MNKYTQKNFELNKMTPVLMHLAIFGSLLLDNFLATINSLKKINI